jgi:hypothetical protein
MICVWWSASRILQGARLSKPTTRQLPSFVLSYEVIYDRCFGIATIRDSYEKTGQMPASLEQALNQRRGVTLAQATKDIIIEYMPKPRVEKADPSLNRQLKCLTMLTPETEESQRGEEGSHSHREASPRLHAYFQKDQ